MKLEVLTLNNFRQFVGEQTLSFSQDKEKNITVIHGENGAGKTALLNSLYWIFYDEIYLPDADKIVNEKAIAESDVGDEIKVEGVLKFSHDEKIYTIQRKKFFRKGNENDIKGELISEDFNLEYIDNQGKSIERNNPQKAIKQILPEDISKLFFFHGEYINELSKENQQDEIQKDIKIIMGLEILERAIRHLETVAKRFEKKLRDYGDEELRDIIDKKQKKEREVKDLENELENIKNNKKGIEEEISAINEKLKKLEGAKEAQEERERLEERLSKIQGSIVDVEDRLKKEFSERGYYMHLSPIVNEAKQVLDEKREKGELPTHVKKQFVKSILNKKECVCGRTLAEGDEAYQRVQEWMERAGLEGLDEAAFELKSRINEFQNNKDGFFEEVSTLLEEKNELLDEKNTVKDKIDEISVELADKEEEDIKELEERRKRLREEIDRSNQRIGVKKKDIEDLEDKINDLSKKEEKLKVKEEKALLAQKRFKACNKAKKYIEDLFDKFATQVRNEVEEKVGDLHSEFLHKAYWAEISDDYKLKIYKKIGDQKQPVGMSTGERQIASLAFIGGLAEIAKERYEKKKDAIYFKGGIYPIIMDSPFGYLDVVHKKRIAEGMPKLAEQLVVLVTSSQWQGEVEQVMTTKAGKIYELEYHNPNEDPTDYEYTLIKEREK